MRILVRTAAVAAMLLLTACGGKTVTRVDTASTIDLSGRWNDVDSREVSTQMVTSILNAPWRDRWEREKGGVRPTIIVGQIANRSSEHVATETFTKDIERAFITSGGIRLVASSEERDGVRDERRDQQDFSDPATVKEFGKELGADFMLMGTINSITDEEGKKKVVFYQVDLDLTNIQTNEKVFLDQKEIKKFIER